MLARLRTVSFQGEMHRRGWARARAISGVPKRPPDQVCDIRSYYGLPSRSYKKYLVLSYSYHCFPPVRGFYNSTDAAGTIASKQSIPTDSIISSTKHKVVPRTCSLSPHLVLLYLHFSRAGT